ncbi:hypothetical protein Pint_10220 [Pistacia integerrima]|uniref:Uncharacterized protein n=1 Tax=Pistacia integerrima TaxID=434235 RepID=A0ACC0XHW4_9ROSI|nr:hypothetical protein Pint_10220 [Pistacia integerrima]
MISSFIFHFAELAHTMKVTENCDAYSFGVFALEVIKGKHPGDIIPTLSSPFTWKNLLLNNVLDESLPLPPPTIQDQLIAITKLTIDCFDSNPNFRPTMNMVSHMFSTKMDLP